VIAWNWALFFAPSRKVTTRIAPSLAMDRQSGWISPYGPADPVMPVVANGLSEYSRTSSGLRPHSNFILL
jgi:hypothetical protein